MMNGCKPDSNDKKFERLIRQIIVRETEKEFERILNPRPQIWGFCPSATKTVTQVVDLKVV